MKVIVSAVSIIVVSVAIFLVVGHMSMVKTVDGVCQRDFWSNSEGEKIGVVVSFEKATKRYEQVSYYADTKSTLRKETGNFEIKLLSVRLLQDGKYSGCVELKYNVFNGSFTNNELNYQKIK